MKKKNYSASELAKMSAELAEASQEAADIDMSRVGDIKMTTPFSLLLQLSGLSHREAADYLAVRLDTIKSWSSGRNTCPDGAIADMRRLIAKQDRTAVETLAQIAQLETDHRSPDVVELGEPIDDDDAQSIGWPCVGAWRGMAARVVRASPRGVTIQIVPRGSTRYYGANATKDPGQ